MSGSRQPSLYARWTRDGARGRIGNHHLTDIAIQGKQLDHQSKTSNRREMSPTEPYRQGSGETGAYVESVCRGQTRHHDPPPPQGGGEYGGCNGNFHKQLCQGKWQKGIVLASLQGSTWVNVIAKAHSSCCSKLPEHLATIYPLRFLANSFAI